MTGTQAVDYFNYTDQYYITSSSSLKLDNNSKQIQRGSEVKEDKFLTVIFKIIAGQVYKLY